MTLQRRTMLAAIAVPLAAADRAAATGESMRHAINSFVGGAPLRDGRVAIEIASLVENGNTVPVTVTVDSPMTSAHHVAAIALFTPRNPQPDVIVCHLSPRSGRARVATRIRFATSQTLHAVARLSDGSCWQATVDVMVTLAACVEG